MSSSTTRESDKFMLRLPSGMRGRIKSKADQNGRSMNSEIISTLAKEYPQQVLDTEALAKTLSTFHQLSAEQREETVDALNQRFEQERSFLRVQISDGKFVFDVPPVNE